MASSIHPTAIIDPGASFGTDVSVGPYSVINDNAVIGDGAEIGSHVLVGSCTTIGKSCRLFHGASIGAIAQDLKYRGEEATLTIGDDAIIREFCTINRGTAASGATIIGNNCAFLAYCHVAHDCIVGDNVVMSNNATLGGHVTIGNHVGIGGFVAIHQFSKVGDHSFIGARSLIVKDIIPFSLCAAGGSGTERIVGINKVGLERRGFDQDRRSKIKRAYKILFREGLAVGDALKKLEDNYADDSDVAKIISFVKQSDRGIYNMNL